MKDWLDYWKLRFSDPLKDAESLKLLKISRPILGK